MVNINKIAQGVTNFIGAEGLADQMGANIARTKFLLQGDKGAARQVQDPSGKKVLGSALQTGATFALPFAGKAASLGTKVLKGATTGYTADVGQNLQLGRDGLNAMRPGIGTAAMGALPVLGKIVGFAAKDATGALAKKLEDTNLRLTPVERQNLARKGQDIVSFLTKNKVVGTPEQRLARVANMYEAMENRVQSVVAKANVTFPTATIVDELNKIPRAFVADPELQKEAMSTVSTLVNNLVSQRGQSLTGPAINELKRNYMNRAFAKNATDVVSESRLAIAALLNGELRKAVKALEPLNKEYGYLIASRSALRKATSRNQIGLTGKLIGIATGGAIGQALGGPVGMAAGTMVGPTIGKTVAGTLPRSAVGAGAQTISNLAERISKLPTDKAGNVSKKVLLNLLQSLKE